LALAVAMTGCLCRLMSTMVPPQAAHASHCCLALATALMKCLRGRWV